VQLRYLPKQPVSTTSTALYTLNTEKNSKIALHSGIGLKFNDSITKVDTKAIRIFYDNDSVNSTSVTYEVSNHGYNLVLKPEKGGKSTLKAIINARAFTTLHDSTNRKADTLNYGIAQENDFGIIHIMCTQNPPFLVQLVDDAGTIVKQTSNTPKYDFTWINPGNYRIRVVTDSNKNMRWDTGNQQLGIEPEEIKYYKEKILVKPNWEIDEVSLP
jgi:hypothetical protein